MLAIVALFVAALPDPSASLGAAGARVPAEPLAPWFDEREDHLAPSTRERSKKERWRREKSARPDAHTTDAELAGARLPPKARPRRAPSPEREAEARLSEALPSIGRSVQPLTTLYNIWNREAFPMLPGSPYKRPFQIFLRDRYTQEATSADPRLATLLVAAALRFRSPRVEVVSGYRSPKYNLMLRKKGRQVARESQHTQGTAVDFRVRGATTEALNDFVRSLRMGGVGYYARTKFIHADTGKVRYWSGS